MGSVVVIRLNAEFLRPHAIAAIAPTIIDLYLLVMDYFGDLRFIGAGRAPRCCVWIDRRFPYHALNFARAGTLWWQSPGRRRVPLRGPVAFWTAPGRRYAYGCDAGQQWDQSFITFHGPRAERMRRLGLLPDAAQPWQPVHDAAAFGERFDALLDQVQAGTAGDRAVLLLEDLLLSLHEPPPVPQLADDPVAAAARAMRERPDRDWDTAALADDACLSLVQFRRRFKAATGLPPTAYLIRHRMFRAADQLRTTDDPAGRVGADVGYPDPYHFSKLFKQHLGLSPTAYRRAMALPQADEADAPRRREA